MQLLSLQIPGSTKKSACTSSQELMAVFAPGVLEVTRCHISKVKVGHGGNIYATETGRSCKPGPFCPIGTFTSVSLLGIIFLIALS